MHIIGMMMMMMMIRKLRECTHLGQIEGRSHQIEQKIDFLLFQLVLQLCLSTTHSTFNGQLSTLCRFQIDLNGEFGQQVFGSEQIFPKTNKKSRDTLFPGFTEIDRYG